MRSPLVCELGDGSPFRGPQDGQGLSEAPVPQRDCSPTEAETEDDEEEEEAAAASPREKRQSWLREKLRAVGIHLQTFCLSL